MLEISQPSPGKPACGRSPQGVSVMKVFKAFIFVFIVAFAVDATVYHGEYRQRYGAHLHAAASRVSDLDWSGLGPGQS
jgi:hypothetical protein